MALSTIRHVKIFATFGTSDNRKYSDIYIVSTVNFGLKDNIKGKTWTLLFRSVVDEEQGARAPMASEIHTFLGNFLSFWLWHKLGVSCSSLFNFIESDQLINFSHSEVSRK